VRREWEHLAAIPRLDLLDGGSSFGHVHRVSLEHEHTIDLEEEHVIADVIAQPNRHLAEGISALLDLPHVIVGKRLLDLKHSILPNQCSSLSLPMLQT